MIFQFSNFVLFGSPSTHVRQIDSVWVDKSVNRPHWEMFMNRLTSKWNGLATYSTVMLAVDVSFLAVPAIGQRPSVQIALYALVHGCFCSSCAKRMTWSTKAAFMARMTQSLHGKENLAIIFSLPYALVIW
ncbi:hypothetical protein EDB19DRAFT_239474 [Suillus lakei]|nr:hypothetical protein EDB19DRAFT_239474 [Suillus lakei]